MISCVARHASVSLAEADAGMHGGRSGVGGVGSLPAVLPNSGRAHGALPEVVHGDAERAAAGFVNLVLLTKVVVAHVMAPPSIMVLEKQHKAVAIAKTALATGRSLADTAGVQDITLLEELEAPPVPKRLTHRVRLEIRAC